MAEDLGFSLDDLDNLERSVAVNGVVTLEEAIAAGMTEAQFREMDTDSSGTLDQVVRVANGSWLHDGVPPSRSIPPPVRLPDDAIGQTLIGAPPGLCYQSQVAPLISRDWP